MNLSEIKSMINKSEEMGKVKVTSQIEDFKLSLRAYDENQEEVLVSVESSFLVEGPAGSGKSMLAIIKLLELERDKKDYNIIIYTKALKAFLEGKMKKMNLKSIENKIFYEDEYDRLPQNNVDYIIIDEVQDMSLSKLDEYRNISNVGIYLYGDSAQQLYPNKTDGKNIIEKVSNKYDLKKYKLKQTYRFPKHIAMFAEQINKKAKNLSNVCYNNGGIDNIPKIIQFESYKLEMDYIASIIKNEGWKSVGILVRKNTYVEKVFKSLARRGVPCEFKDKNRSTLDFSTDRPKIITYHSSKGLEFERVFVPQCDVFEEADERKKLNLKEALFVAFTRASMTLIVSYENGQKSPYLNEIDESTYIFESR